MTDLHPAVATPWDAGARLPDDDALREGLEAIFRSLGHHGDLTLIERTPSIRTSTFPAEIVVCRTGDGRELRLYCKYEHGGGSLAHGHRGGVSYEARVYRDVLAPLGLSSPGFVGSWIDPRTGNTCLVLDYVDNSLRLSSAPDTDRALTLAARWLAAFHRDGAPAARSATWLKHYDAAYYLGWAERARMLADQFQLDLQWLPAVSRAYEELVDALLGDPPTLVHGEFYSANVIFRDGSLCVVDWESAAVGSGAIDVASVVHEWPDEIVAACHAEYARARFGEASPPGWDEALAAARLYWEFRWLGDDPVPPERVAVREFELLRRLSEELGL